MVKQCYSVNIYFDDMICPCKEPTEKWENNCLFNISVLHSCWSVSVRWLYFLLSVNHEGILDRQNLQSAKFTEWYQNFWKVPVALKISSKTINKRQKAKNLRCWISKDKSDSSTPHCLPEFFFFHTSWFKRIRICQVPNSEECPHGH